MTYKETVQYLYDSVPMFHKEGAVAYKEGLDNTHALDSHFGHPHRKFRTIHVAGTNGKGSCSHTLAAILQAGGYRVGLYTSPHLVSFRERIRVNGVPVSEEYVVDFIEHERAFFEPLHPSFFELTTALAFKYFADSKVDIAVIEVGLGGRLDCTNIISPVLSVITNISLDHTQFLGDTPAKIASEKAGIIKPHTPVVIGEYTDETRAVFTAKAHEEKAPIYFAEDENEIVSAEPQTDGGMLYTTRGYGKIKGELGGIYQVKNTATVLCAAKRLLEAGILTDTASIAAGTAGAASLTGLAGRWQKIQERPAVVCDTGHNTGGWAYLGKQLGMQKCRQMRIVFGMVDDKDIDGVMSLMPRDAVYYFTKASTHRAVNEADVCRHGGEHGLKGTCHADVKSAYMAAMADAGADDFIFVGGSSYVVADFLTYCV